jgi:hypothetical protein
MMSDKTFEISQLTDAMVSLHFEKVKVSSKIIQVIKFDSFFADTNCKIVIYPIVSIR